MIKDKDKTKEQLINDLAELRQRIAELEASETERKQAEEALAETNQLLETILDYTHMLVVYLDPQFNFVRVNRAYAEADERESSFFPGKNHFDLYPNAENEEIFRCVVETGEPYFAYAKPFEYAEHPERGVTYWDWSLVPIKDPGGAVTGLVFTLVNVTGRVRAEEQLQRYAVELEQRNEELKAFAYSVSHDLRAPLISIKGFSRELDRALREMDSALNACLPHVDEKERVKITALFQENVLEALGFINSSVSRMDRLISAILKLSRLGRQELTPGAINMEDLVQSILNSMAHQIEERSVRVTVSALPEVVADRISMEQIVGNILDNAVKYLEPGRPGEIEITAECSLEETTFHIRDNGWGIAKKDIPKIFDLFRRAGKQDVPGEGMGLAYARTLIRRHGGRLWCESEPGVGTTFSFTIPRKQS